MASDRMNTPSRSTVLATRFGRSSRRGFTLIEVMIVVAIVAILAAVALPSYRDYILRGQLVDATNLLSANQVSMERYFQDNRRYDTYTVGANTFNPPCAAAPVLHNFVLTCTGGDTPTATGYTLRATGNGPVNGFVYTVTQTGAQATVTLGSGWTGAPAACWIV